MYIYINAKFKEILGAAGEKNSKFGTPPPHQNSKFDPSPPLKKLPFLPPPPTLLNGTALTKKGLFDIIGFL